MPAALPSYVTLSAMITPAIFLTANGSLIISTSNRMSRIVDRIRVLNDLGDKICRGGTDLDYTQDRLAQVHDQLNRLVASARLDRFGRGERVIEEGGDGNSMFVLIRGTAHVSVTKNESAIRVGVLRTGDCFGEMVEGGLGSFAAAFRQERP